MNARYPNCTRVFPRTKTGQSDPRGLSRFSVAMFARTTNEKSTGPLKRTRVPIPEKRILTWKVWTCPTISFLGETTRSSWPRKKVNSYGLRFTVTQLTTIFDLAFLRALRIKLSWHVEWRLNFVRLALVHDGLEFIRDAPIIIDRFQCWVVSVLHVTEYLKKRIILLIRASLFSFLLLEIVTMILINGKLISFANFGTWSVIKKITLQMEKKYKQGLLFDRKPSDNWHTCFC